MTQHGYYRFPTISGDRVVFVCEDDLWSVPVQGGVAIRLTANLGAVTRPWLSPDGHHLAFVGREEGHSEVYGMAATGGVAQRLTYLGGAVVAGWTTDSQSIVLVSSAGQPFAKMSQLYRLAPEGGLPEPLPYGLAHSVAFDPAGAGVVIGRNTSDPARWKRYRGGRVGVLWVDATGSGEFRPLIHLNGNLDCPMWIGDRIYFLSDHEGIGNLYSCTPSGEDIRQHTHHHEYYVRHACSDGRRIVYHAGAELFCFDPQASTEQRIAVEFHSPRIQRQRKFVEAQEFLEDYDLHPEGHSTVITTRGKSFCFGNWEGAVLPLGLPEEGRYRLTRWLKDGKRFVAICDRSGVETLEILTSEFDQPPQPLAGLDLGRATGLDVSPTADQVVLTNHRHELIWVDLATGDYRLLDRSDFAPIRGVSWSPDGIWVAYDCTETQHTSAIKLCRPSDGTIHRLTTGRFRDMQPAFDPGGKFLYFLSVREFNPVYDSIYFDLSFPKGMRPCLISLQRDTPSPFVPVPKPLHKSHAAKASGKPGEEDVAPHAAEPAESDESKPKPAKGAVQPIEIDFEGIEQRIVGFPVAEGIYHQIWGIEGKVLFTSFPVQGSFDGRYTNGKSDPKPTLELYDFDAQKQERIATDVTNFKVGRDHKTLIYRSRDRLRVCTITPQDRDRKETEPGRKSGWLDLNRIRVAVTPAQEWQQMFREIWRLQQEQFWTADLSGVDWQRVYQRYAPLLDRVTTRSEFSDLIWEMQGELGTSHAYESGGDYREEPKYHMGFLGADFSYDAASDAYRIEHIVRGDSWTDQDSPLNRMGLNIQEGDRLLAIAGQRLSRTRSPQELLVHQAGCEVSLTVADATSGEIRTVTVKTLRNERTLRYREWVERNHQAVSDASSGRVGYVHIPNMGPAGYAEFHRYYLVEAHKEALIVDVRYNSGGHVSELILEKLMRQRSGYVISRWGKPRSYPRDTVLGPIVALADEHAGSDGDIFSHCFKLMKLGTLIGKRTWGGVIGISPRHRLVDNSVVTQPEYCFWFNDVGWGVENYGTDPDIAVDITPQDWVRGQDPQLETAIRVALEQLELQPVAVPDFGNRPYLPLPD
ncbi:MAG: PDZ domain-containing protein [Synechococcales cyanobacterium M58_A2018_015]|nr:PDZ domain-containing protein [Synechococcales cyanobacterium M58_A2018_015]